MIARTVLIVLGVLVLYQLVTRVLRKIIHVPAPAFIGQYLDSGLRKALQRPGTVIARSGLGEGMVVLEIGCGSGAYTTQAARVVGSRGRVYALDVQPGMLEQLKRKLERPEHRDLENVEPVRASAYDLPFEDGLFDLVYIVTVLQEIPDQQCALREARRVLKPDGVMAVTEFLPDPDYPLKRTTVKALQRAGFVLDHSAGGLWNYTVRCRAPGLPGASGAPQVDQS